MVPINWLIDTLIKLSASILIYLNWRAHREKHVYFGSSVPFRILYGEHRILFTAHIYGKQLIIMVALERLFGSVCSGPCLPSLLISPRSVLRGHQLSRYVVA
jgi:hypothetical protein